MVGFLEYVCCYCHGLVFEGGAIERSSVSGVMRGGGGECWNVSMGWIRKGESVLE